MLFWELKKLLQRRSTLVSVLLALAVCLCTAFVSSFSSYDTAYDAFTEQACQAKLRWRDSAAAWEGAVTGDKLLAALSGVDVSTPDSRDRTLHPTAPLQALAGIGLGQAQLQECETVLFPTADLTDAQRAALSDFYMLRREKLEEMLAQQLKTSRDRALFLSMDDTVPTPYVFSYALPHDSFCNNLIVVQLFCMLLTCVIIAPVFTVEYQTRAAHLVLCTRHGRGQLAKAKLAAALLVSGGVYLVCMTVYVGVQLALFGTHGLDGSFQLTSWYAVLPVTLGQAELLGIGLGFLAVLASAAITAALSAALSSAFHVYVIVDGVLLLVPMFGGAVAAIRPYAQLLPFNNYFAELTQFRVYHPFGIPVWQPVMQCCMLLLYIAVCLPLAGWVYTNHQVK